MPRAAYTVASYRYDPLGFLIKLMHLEAHQRALRNWPDALPVLTGIIAYRKLQQQQRITLTNEVLGPLKQRTGERTHLMMLSKLYDILSQIPANPYWFTWSLSDQELRDIYERNYTVARAMELLGFSVAPSITVAGTATAIMKASRQGAGRAAARTIMDKTHGSAAQSAARMAGMTRAQALSAGVLAAITTVFATILHIQVKEDHRAAKQELGARGLLTYEEMGR